MQEKKAIQHRILFKPYIVLLMISVLSGSVYILYCTGLLRSYRVTFISHDFFGYLSVVLFYYILISFCFLFSNTRHSISKTLRCLRPQKVLIIIYLFLLVSLFGFTRLTVKILGNYGISHLIYMLLRNRQLDYLITGSGNTTLSVFSQASLILLALIFDHHKRVHRVTLLFNLILLFAYSSFLSSRVLFIEGTVFFTIILIRRFYYQRETKSIRFFLIVFIALFMLILTSGYRDFDQMGIQYTDSRIDWGVSRLLDYFISTGNTSLEIVDYMDGRSMRFPIGTFQLLTDILPSDNKTNLLGFRMSINPHEYTNMGAIVAIYSDYKYLSCIFVAVYGMICGLMWRSFDSGHLFGMMMYPMFFYSCLEIWRLYYFGTTLAEVLLILVCLSFIFVKSSFTYYDIN